MCYDNIVEQSANVTLSYNGPENFSCRFPELKQRQIYPLTIV